MFWNEVRRIPSITGRGLVGPLGRAWPLAGLLCGVLGQGLFVASVHAVATLAVPEN